MRTNRLKEIYKTIDTGTAQEKLANLPEFPRIIEFEVTNHCNFRCIMCPTGTETAKRLRGYMSEDVYNKLIDEISKYKVALKFVGQGEPLLHPQIIDYVKLAKEKGIITHLTTNGSLFTEEMMKRIIEEELLDSVKFSFQGINPFGYTMLRQKDNFNNLMDIISTFYILRGNKTYPYITIGTSVTDESDDEIDAFIESASRICDKVEVGITQLVDSELSAIKDEYYKKKYKELKAHQIQFKKRYICCPQVYDTITVRWNGDISACCGDIDGTMTLGNIKDCSILDCWNGSRERKYRNILAEGRYDDIEACKDCYDFYGWTYGAN